MPSSRPWRPFFVLCVALILFGSGCASYVRGVGVFDGDRTLERKMQQFTPLGTTGPDTLAAIYRQTRKNAPRLMAYEPWIAALEQQEARELAISALVAPEIWVSLSYNTLSGILFPETALARWIFSPDGKLEKIEIHRAIDSL